MKAMPIEPINVEPEMNVYNIFNAHELLTFEDQATCLSVLQKSFDLKKMLLNFSLLIKEYIRDFSVTFQSPQGHFKYETTQPNVYSDSFNLSIPSKSKRVGTIIYQSDKLLTSKENKQLIELHKLLIPCLRQALQVSELNKLIFKDHLTKVNNRAYYCESIDRAIEQSNRTQQELALMVLDIDDFKIVNDTFGHLMGDDILVEFAKELKKAVRSSDSIFRIGGDEFVILLQPGNQQSIDKVLGRLYSGIRTNKQLQEVNFSCSAGHAQWKIEDTPESIFTRADKSLYANKKLKQSLRHN